VTETMCCILREPSRLTKQVLKDRYQKELRWQMCNPEREDLTLQLWIDAIEEERSKL
jgi:hypothetical protein